MRGTTVLTRALAGLALSAAALGAVPLSAATAAPAPRVETVADLEKAVEALQATLDARTATLVKATEGYEAGRREVQRLQQLELRAGFSLDATTAALQEAQRALDAFANRAYRQPVGPEVAAVFAGDVRAFVDYRGVQRALNTSSSDQRRAVEQLAASRAAAEEVVAGRVAATDRAQDVQRRNDAALDALRNQAAATGAELKTVFARLEELRARIVPVGAACSALPDEQFVNGFLPAGALCPLDGAPGHALRPAAAAAFNAMTEAYRQQTGQNLCVTDSYRSYDAQVAVFAAKPNLAATPGRSNHGFGLAVDFCGGIQSFGSPAHRWMQEHAGEYGWVHPAWAQQGGSRPEAWHWEYGAL